MATNGNSNGASASSPQTVAAQRAGMAQALEELAKGERAAAKLENELQAFEARLDSLLTSLGMTEADLEVADTADTADTKPEAAESKPGEKKDSKE